MSGIQVTGSGTYEKNFIHSFSSSSSSATMNGINLTGGPYTISNNMLRLGITSTGSGINTGTIINGINEITGSNSFYYNSVYIGGNPTTTANSTYAFRSASVSASRNYVNNIFLMPGLTAARPENIMQFSLLQTPDARARTMICMSQEPAECLDSTVLTE